MITAEKLIKVASYLTKIHHTKGRIRVRVDPAIKQEATHVTLEDIETLEKRIQGITKIKINKLMGSITVLYDPSISPFSLWEDLLSNENTEMLVERVNNLAKEVE